MPIPVSHDVSVTGVGESVWLPLNRYGSSTTIFEGAVTGTATFSVVGTFDKVQRVATPEEVVISDLSALSATTVVTRDLPLEAVKLKVTSGTGTVRLRLQSEGW